ncbi:hypothetical protein [Peribacillus alkalitolerans]|uniref:hypothetical protein n=1 Tax=Peribacillus alkalitolerans TaxID=1550385 RepID=UPI0013D26067|nr:hypothetical protein [Peribacillus alkalitolerans]
MRTFGSFHGTVTMINDFNVSGNEELTGCYKLMTLTNDEGTVVNFIISPTTYFLNHVMVVVGDRVTGYYDVNVPVVLIYPPQYEAIIIAKDTPYQNVKVAYFDNQLLSSDGQLKLNLSSFTPIWLRNDQPFTHYPGNRDLLVVYGPTTMSIPAQTTPYKIIVMC